MFLVRSRAHFEVGAVFQSINDSVVPLFISCVTSPEKEMTVPGRVIINLIGDRRRCIVDENWLLMDLLAIDRLPDDQSNDKRVKVVRGYIYEVLSER
jgi:hypothetical protein